MALTAFEAFKPSRITADDFTFLGVRSFRLCNGLLHIDTGYLQPEGHPSSGAHLTVTLPARHLHGQDATMTLTTRVTDWSIALTSDGIAGTLFTYTAQQADEIYIDINCGGERYKAVVA